MYPTLKLRDDPNTVYACFDNHKNGDFKPYVLRSTDRGKTWVNIGGNLPERGSAYTIAVDHEIGDLLFVGTEFGVFATRDGGKEWHSLKGGMPPIAVRDLEIQRRESDLVVGTFGRGIYILDDYSPLRHLSPQVVAKLSAILPVKKALLYVQAAPLAGGEKAYQGASFYTAPNPPFGATFTYYLKDSLKTKKATRREQEQKLEREGKDISYPTWDALKSEDREETPTLILTIKNAAGDVIRRLTVPTTSGLHRVTWDLRRPSYRPISEDRPARGDDDDDDGPSQGGNGPLALPGSYTVSLEKREDQATTELVGPTPFVVEPLNFATLPPGDRQVILAFAKETGELQRAALGALEALNEGLGQVTNIKRLIERTPSLSLKLRQDAQDPRAQANRYARAIHGGSHQVAPLRAGADGPCRAHRNDHSRALDDHIGPDQFPSPELRHRRGRIRGRPGEPSSTPGARSARTPRDPRSRRRAWAPGRKLPKWKR